MAAHKGNKYALGNNGGRPPKYKTPEELNKKCIEYFDYCEENKIRITISGLPLFLGFSCRSNLDKYAEKSQEFKYIIKRAKLVIADAKENEGRAVDIFALKQMGWKDSKSTDITTKGESINLTNEQIKIINSQLDDEV